MSLKLSPGVPIEEIPLMRPPNRQRPNFNAPAHAEKSLIILNAIWLPIIVTVVLIRFISRQGMARQKFALDDGWVRSAFSTSLGYMMLQRILQLTVVETIYAVIITSKSSRILIYVGVAFCTIIAIPFFGVAVSRNVRCNGQAAVHEAVCCATFTSLTAMIYSALNVVSDFYILFIPIRQLNGLHMNRNRKMGLIAHFMVGFVAHAMSVIRFGFLASEYCIGDQFYSVALVSHFTTVGINLAIVCSCMIFFPSFVRSGKTSAESALRYLLSKTGKSRSQVQIPDNYGQPPPPLCEVGGGLDVHFRVIKF